MENELYKMINGLMVIVEKNLAGDNTDKETVTEVDEYFENALKMWKEYKKECKLQNEAIGHKNNSRSGTRI